jgi:hypothetical protein
MQLMQKHQRITSEYMIHPLRDTGCMFFHSPLLLRTV